MRSKAAARFLRVHFDLLRAAGAALIVVVVFGTVGFVARSQQNHTNDQFRRLLASQQRLLAKQQQLIDAQYLSLVETCQRLQSVRSQDNAGRLAEFGICKTVLALPGLGELHTRLQDSLKLLTWTPRTACKHAVNTKGVRYRAPLPVLFTTRPPPHSALVP